MPNPQVETDSTPGEVPSPHAPETEMSAAGTPIPNLDVIRRNVSTRLDTIKSELTNARTERDRQATIIRKLVAEQTDLERVARSFQPRTRKAKS